MQQVELFPVPNPCVGVCQSNAKGFCMGCLRSRAERQKWNELMPAEKMRIIELCDLRRAKLEALIKAKREGVAPISSEVASNPAQDALANSSLSASLSESVEPEQGSFFGE